MIALETKIDHYNSVENYKRLFADILADVCPDSPECDETVANMLEGFETAIIEWMAYHDSCQKKFREIHGKFMRGEFAIERARQENEEASY